MLELWKKISDKHSTALHVCELEVMKREINGNKDSAVGQSDIKRLCVLAGVSPSLTSPSCCTCVCWLVCRRH
jgi:hypothetical protein